MLAGKRSCWNAACLQDWTSFPQSLHTATKVAVLWGLVVMSTCGQEAGAGQEAGRGRAQPQPRRI